MEKNHLIHDRQTGFRDRRLTGDMQTYHWSYIIEYYGEFELVALAKSKACDLVLLDALLDKFPFYDFHQNPSL